MSAPKTRFSFIDGRLLCELNRVSCAHSPQRKLLWKRVLLCSYFRLALVRPGRRVRECSRRAKGLDLEATQPSLGEFVDPRSTRCIASGPSSQSLTRKTDPVA